LRQMNCVIQQKLIVSVPLKRKKLETIIEIIFGIVGDTIIVAIFEFITEIISKILILGVDVHEKPTTLLQYLSYLSIGLIFGVLSYLVMPFQMFQKSYVPGISIVIVPAICGTIMFLWGSRQKKIGKVYTNLSTFWGGVVFGFGYTAVRLLIIKIL
jgi:hypothetical protein